MFMQSVNQVFTGINASICCHLSHLPRFLIDILSPSSSFFSLPTPTFFSHIFQNWYKHDKFHFSKLLFSTYVSENSEWVSWKSFIHSCGWVIGNESKCIGLYLGQLANIINFERKSIIKFSNFLLLGYEWLVKVKLG